MSENIETVETVERKPELRKWQHVFENSNFPSGFDSNCLICGGKARDSVHGDTDVIREQLVINASSNFERKGGGVESVNKANLSMKLRRFAALVETEQIARLKAEDLSCEANLLNAKTNFHIGRKYSRVDVGSSGKYMVDNQTEEIFGIKGYGVIHKGHRFGTLDTINDWSWGDYRAIKK